MPVTRCAHNRCPQPAHRRPRAPFAPVDSSTRCLCPPDGTPESIKQEFGIVDDFTLEEKIATLRAYPFLRKGCNDIPDLKEAHEVLKAEEEKAEKEKAEKEKAEKEKAKAERIKAKAEKAKAAADGAEAAGGAEAADGGAEAADGAAAASS